MSRITDLLRLEHPIVQGPFGGGLSSVALAAAVSNAGGLGSFGAQHLDPDELTATIRALHAATDRAFNVNLWVSTHDVPEDEYDGWDEAAAQLRPLYDELGVPAPARPRPAAHGFDAAGRGADRGAAARLLASCTASRRSRSSRPAARPGS